MNKKINIACLLLSVLATASAVAQEDQITKNGSAGICAGYLTSLELLISAGTNVSQDELRVMRESQALVNLLRDKYLSETYTRMLEGMMDRSAKAITSGDRAGISAIQALALYACSEVSVEIPRYQ